MKHPTGAPIRYTALSGVYPVGHGSSREGALLEAARRMRPGQRVTSVELRLRDYPFTKLEAEQIK